MHFSTLYLIVFENPRWEGKTGNLGEDMLISAEESVMANFDFLSREDDIEDEDEVTIIINFTRHSPIM